MRELITIGGRQFRAAAVMTLEHDWFVMGRLRAAGLDTIVKIESESTEDYAHRMLTALESSPQVAEIVAAGLMPVDLVDEQWSPGIAAEIALVVRGVTDPEEKLTVRRILLEWLIPFLQSGLARLLVSRPSSDVAASQDGSAQDRNRGTAHASASGAH